jgi:hypothetical protein
MRKIHVLATLFAILALSAFAATSAFATTSEWLEDAKAMGAAGASTITGELELTDAGIGTTALCEGSFDGTVGPGGEDMIELVLDKAGNEVTAAKPITCSFVKLGPCLSTSAPVLWPLHLPWLTEIELMTVGTEDLYLDKIMSGGQGEPGYALLCFDKVFNLDVTDECTNSTSADLENMLGEKDVLGIFNPGNGINSEKAKCSIGGANTGELVGEGLITLDNGLDLEVSG